MRLPMPREPEWSITQMRSFSSRQISMKWFPVPSVPRWREVLRAHAGMLGAERLVGGLEIVRPGFFDGSRDHAPGAHVAGAAVVGAAHGHRSLDGRADVFQIAERIARQIGAR